METSASEAAQHQELGSSSVYGPLVAIALGVVEQTCHDDVDELMQDLELWQDLVPARNLTMEWLSAAFRTLSSMDCLVYSLLTHEFKRPKYRLFGVLSNPEVANVLEGLPQCCLDDFSKSFLAAVAVDGGLTSPVSLAKLKLLATLARSNIVAIEAKHASIRRRLQTRGVQTHAESLQELSA